MIKGVNRQMIEVTHTGSPYFERAFLVVRGDIVADEKKLHGLAQKVVEQASSYSGLRRGRWLRLLRQGGYALLWSGCGAAVSWLIQQWL